MSIIRHEIRQISDENRGQPIISQAVIHGNVVYPRLVTVARQTKGGEGLLSLTAPCT